jgi:hypothetical protein
MNPWIKLLADIFGFFILLARRPRVLLFFVIIVLGVGGLGVWIPLGQHLNDGAIFEIDVYRSFATYIIAIAITSFAEFLLRKDDEDNRTLTLFLLGMALVGTVPAIIILFNNSIQWAHICALISAIATLWLWFIALSGSEAFEEGDARVTLGD